MSEFIITIHLYIKFSVQKPGSGNDVFCVFQIKLILKGPITTAADDTLSFIISSPEPKAQGKLL